MSQTTSDSGGNWIPCDNYTLEITLNFPSGGLTFDLWMRDTNQNAYHLPVENDDEDIDLVQAALRAMADAWPKHDLQFQATGTKITAVRLKPKP